MRPKVYSEFERICSERNAGGAVLEVGAIPSEESLLCMKSLRSATQKVGVNLDGPYTYKDFTILKCNANSMNCFGDNTFDTILCNSVLEHDKFFWQTISEMRRVTKPGGLFVIGAPGYVPEFQVTRHLSFSQKMLVMIACRCLDYLVGGTITLKVHNYPGDFYRFTTQTFREVFFHGMPPVSG